ncbi:hypothetical protein D3C75_1233870 [compost metagenome]
MSELACLWNIHRNNPAIQRGDAAREVHSKLRDLLALDVQAPTNRGRQRHLRFFRSITIHERDLWINGRLRDGLQFEVTKGDGRTVEIKHRYFLSQLM